MSDFYYLSGRADLDPVRVSDSCFRYLFPDSFPYTKFYSLNPTKLNTSIASSVAFVEEVGASPVPTFGGEDSFDCAFEFDEFCRGGFLLVLLRI